MITPWMDIAKKEMGISEVPGKQDNPKIIDYLETTDYDLPSGYIDEIPWCSAFVNWCLEQSHIPGTNSAWSQSWRKWGKELINPEYGAIVIFNWGGIKGHVGFIYDADDNGIFVLGGNQHNSVNITYYYYDNVVDYRWPKGV